jgi:uncharacterized protein YjdB/formylglycine-generating enzyme required for sulfatase activity
MKTRNRGFACLAAVIVCGFVFTGCDNGNIPTSGDIPVTGVTLDETEFGLLLDEEKVLNHTVLPAKATNKKVIWLSSLPRVATVTGGVVTGVSEGTATITVIADDGDGQFKASCVVTVSRIAVTGVTLDKTTLPLPVGGSGTLTATVLPENAANKSVRWETSDDSKATVTVDATTGVATVKAVAAGTATITVRTNNGLTAPCAVTVTPVAVTGVTLDQPALSLDIWDSQRLIPTVSPENATDKNVTWSSDKPNVATVSTTGTVTGVAVGTATITVTTADGGKKGTCDVTVRLFAVPEIDMVLIGSGFFMMGSPEGEEGHFPDEDNPDFTNETLHKVTLTKGFYMGQYQVTQAQYRAVMKTNPSYFNVEEDKDIAEYAGDWPVDTVNWYDAVEFCNKMSTLKGLAPVYTITGRTPATGYPITSATVTCNWNASGYRLPTEAEWEYACRAGTTTPFNFYDEETGKWGSNYITTARANFDGRYPYNGRPAGGEWLQKTLSWRAYEDYPNQWVLYNMHGMLEEWCWDWFGGYGTADQENPTGPDTGNYRILRGGSWYDDPVWVRSAARNGGSPQAAYFADWYGIYPVIGFRVVRGA